MAPAAIKASLTDEQKKETIRKQHAGNPSSSQSKKKSSSGKSSTGKSGTAKSSQGKSAGSSAKKKSSSGSSNGTKKKKRTGSTSSSHGKVSTPKKTDDSFPPPEHQVATTGLAPSGVGAAGAMAAGGAASSGAAQVPASTSVPLPHGAEPSAPITIEKSGEEPDQGLEPLPTPEPAPQGFWARLFGPQKTYQYLSPSVRAAIDRAPVKRSRWKYIVVHNSGTREGNARVFDIYHRRVRHMQNGLAYHFVIGDGHGSGDGQVEIGDRWKRQINGGHVASDYLNDIALGICLVGDFNRDQPTRAQVGALEELIPYLRTRVGKSQGRAAIVHAHKEINPRPTDCPGDHFPYGWLHAKFGNAR
jgi:N-acetylmuramoyl-L-alanine amidase